MTHIFGVAQRASLNRWKVMWASFLGCPLECWHWLWCITPRITGFSWKPKDRLQPCSRTTRSPARSTAWALCG